MNEDLDNKTNIHPDALTEDEITKIKQIWVESAPYKPPSITELIKLIRPQDTKNHGNSRLGKSIREIIISIDPAFKAVHQSREIIFTDAQKEFIEKNCSSLTATAIARIIFEKPTLMSLSAEAVAVKKFLNKFSEKTFHQKPVEVKEKDVAWSPPNTLQRCIDRVNKYLFSNPLPPLVHLPEKRKKELKSLINYLSTMRFKVVLETYDSELDQELFESEFIRCTHDKGDLTEEEVDEYIMYSQEVVNNKNIGKTISSLQEKLDEVLTNDDEKIPMSLVEAIGKMKTDHDQSVKRQQELLKNLKGKRSERLNKQIQNHASLLNLVADWRYEENRKKMIAIAEKRKELIKDEFKRLDEMEEIKARIFGIDLNTVLNG